MAFAAIADDRRCQRIQLLVNAPGAMIRSTDEISEISPSCRWQQRKL
jgi:hypothetical protein